MLFSSDAISSQSVPGQRRTLGLRVHVAVNIAHNNCDLIPSPSHPATTNDDDDHHHDDTRDSAATPVIAFLHRH